jgi:ketosteroid isomerase-like protein
MPDPIAPPAAHRPEEALELVAQYEDSARLLPWARPASTDDCDPRDIMPALMALRLPLSVQVNTVLVISDPSLVICERRITGTGPDCEPVRLSGYGFAAVRPQPDGTWRIAADAWCLKNEIPLDPPEIPPGTGADAVRGEGPGRAASTTQS